MVMFDFEGRLNNDMYTYIMRERGRGGGQHVEM